MKQVLPPGEFVQMFDTQQERHIRAHLLKQLLFNHWGGSRFSNIQKLKVESQTQLLNGLEKLLKFS